MAATRVEPQSCLATTSGDMKVAGLESEVRITRDRWGIPHIQASSVHDAFFGQGYAIAMDRQFQLELRRHQARGTAAALINGGFLAQDRANRRNGLGRLAATEWEAQSPEARMVLEAYGAGINAAIATQPRPFEFHLLDHEMAPWSPVDTLAIMKMVALGNQWVIAHPPGEAAGGEWHRRGAELAARPRPGHGPDHSVRRQVGVPGAPVPSRDRGWHR